MDPNTWNPSETLIEFVKWLDEQPDIVNGATLIDGPARLFQLVHEFGIAKGLKGVSEEWRSEQPSL